MSWPDGKKRGSRPKHLFNLHTDCCEKCGMPRYGLIEFPEQLYGCSVSAAEWRQRKQSVQHPTGDPATK